MIRGRQTILDQYATVTGDLESTRSKLAKLPSRLDPKAAELTARITELEQKAVALKTQLNTVTETLVRETQRFHAEKFAALKQMLVELVQAYMEHSQKELSQLQALLPVVQQMQYQEQPL
eukprot:EC713142.1.p1 GENE.EC713142.1~~EC713142.1.p1  ORF type:complete len:120 (+),score=30.43 EC713142.1:1-360(+)